MSLVTELQRRKVLKIGAAYLVVGWLAVQAASIGFPAFGAPPWVLRVFIFVVLLGFPVALVMAWVLQLTPEGVQVETSAAGSKRLYAVAVVLCALAVAWYYQGQPTYKESDPQAQDGPPSIAVLPFANLSGDPGQEFFSDGMTEEILNVLAKVPDLRVAARTSVFEFKAQGGDIRAIGRKLGVQYIVEGSVRRDGDAVRITAQLIRVADGFHVWSETYDRRLKSVFAIQDEIAKRVAGQLQGSLSRPAPTEDRPGIDPAAYDEYLKGRALHRARKDLPNAVVHLRNATVRAPQFADAWARLALTNEVVFYFTDTLERLALGDLVTEMRTAAARAAELAPDAATTLHALGNVARMEGRFLDAESLYEQSIAADPTYPDVREDHSELLLSVGRDDEALAAAEELVGLEPYVAIFWLRIADAAETLDRPDLQRSATERLVQLAPHLARSIASFMSAEAEPSRIAQVRVDLQNAYLADPTRLGTRWALFRWSQGDPDIPDAIARAAIAGSWQHSGFAALKGDADLLFSSLGTEYDRSLGYQSYARLRGVVARRFISDPRAKRLLRERGFEAYWRIKGWPDLCRPKGDTDFECNAAFATGGK